MTDNVFAGITCAFTGYRPEKLPWGSNENDMRCQKLKEHIYDVVCALYESGIRRFICGMARGCDTYFCEAVFSLREEHDDVHIEAAIPCPQQSHSWTAPDRKRYNRLVSECDECTVIDSEYTPECMLKRNRYMVDKASVLLAVFDGKKGGTAATVSYAQSLDREVIVVNP